MCWMAWGFAGAQNLEYSQDAKTLPAMCFCNSKPVMPFKHCTSRHTVTKEHEHMEKTQSNLVNGQSKPSRPSLVQRIQHRIGETLCIIQLYRPPCSLEVSCLAQAPGQCGSFHRCERGITSVNSLRYKRYLNVIGKNSKQ